MNSYRKIRIAYFTKEYNIYYTMDDDEFYVGDLEARLNRLLLANELDDAPEDPFPPPRTQVDNDLERRLQLLMQDNEADRRERSRRELEERSRREARRVIHSMYPPMTSEPPVRQGRIETGPLISGRRYTMPGTIPYELQRLPLELSSRIRDHLPSHRRDPRRDRAARRIQSRVRTRRQRRNDLQDLYDTMWD